MKETVMFKKIVLAAAVAALAGSANAAVVYQSESAKLQVGGRLDAAINSVALSERAADKKVELVGTARFRVAAESNITDGIKALGFGEWQIGAETSHNDQWNTRFAYVGFKTDDYGQLTFGQNQPAAVIALSATDILIDWGAKATTSYEYAAKARQEGLIDYRYKKSFTNQAVKLGLSYQTAGLATVDSGVSLAGGYEYGEYFPVGLNLAYDYYRVSATAPANLDDKNVLTVSLTGGDLTAGLYAAGLYQYTDYEHKASVHGYELAAGYTWDSGVQFLVLFNEKVQDNAVIVSNFAGELSYKFNPNFRAYVEAEIGAGNIETVNPATGKKIGSTHERSDDKVAFHLQYNY